MNINKLANFQHEISSILSKMKYGDNIDDTVNKKLVLLKTLIPLYYRLLSIDNINADIIYDNTIDIFEETTKNEKKEEKKEEDDVIVHNQLIKELDRLDNMNNMLVKIYE